LTWGRDQNPTGRFILGPKGRRRGPIWAASRCRGLDRARVTRRFLSAAGKSRHRREWENSILIPLGADRAPSRKRVRRARFRGKQGTLAGTLGVKARCASLGSEPVLLTSSLGHQRPAGDRGRAAAKLVNFRTDPDRGGLPETAFRIREHCPTGFLSRPKKRKLPFLSWPFIRPTSPSTTLQKKKIHIHDNLQATAIPAEGASLQGFARATIAGRLCGRQRTMFMVAEHPRRNEVPASALARQIGDSGSKSGHGVEQIMGGT